MQFLDKDPGPEIRRKLNEMVSTWEDALISAVGPQGWSPSLAVVADGARSVLQVIDWVGGEGAKPTVTGYIGATGIVATAALAVDIRGAAGAGTGSVNPSGAIAANDLAAFADTTGQLIKAVKPADLPVSTAQASALATKAPLNGAEASGTWPISITGSAPWAGVTDKPAVIAAGVDAAAARTAISLGTAATADLTTGVFDKTTGAVLKLGDYGVGAMTVALNDAQIESMPSGLCSFTSYETTAFTQYASHLHLGYHNPDYGTLISSQMGNIVPVITVQVKNATWRDRYEMHHSGNIKHSVGQDTNFPMTQKAVTDALAGVGYKNIPQNIQSTSYTCALDDAGKHIFHPAADTTARTYTIPSNAAVPYPIGTALTFINQNGTGGIVTIAITADTMRLAGAGTTGSRTLARNGVATAIKITATEWIISGSGLT